MDALTKRECVLCEMIRYFNDRQQSIHGVGTTDTLGAKPCNEKKKTEPVEVFSLESTVVALIINPCQGRWWWRGCNRRAYIYTVFRYRYRYYYYYRGSQNKGPYKTYVLWYQDNILYTVPCYILVTMYALKYRIPLMNAFAKPNDPYFGTRVPFKMTVPLSL